MNHIFDKNTLNIKTLAYYFIIQHKKLGLFCREINLKILIKKESK